MKKSILFIIFIISFSILLYGCEEAPQAPPVQQYSGDCVVVGGSGPNPSIGPADPNKDKVCCEGLELKPHRMAYDNNCEVGEGFGKVCIACGDGFCDSNHESECNCAEDCDKKYSSKSECVESYTNFYSTYEREYAFGRIIVGFEDYVSKQEAEDYLTDKGLTNFREIFINGWKDDVENDLNFKYMTVIVPIGEEFEWLCEIHGEDIVKNVEISSLQESF